MSYKILSGCVWMLFFAFTDSSFAQSQIVGVSSVWDDSFREWEVYYDEEGLGIVEIKWPLKDDWSQWEISVGDYEGFIKQRFNSNPNQWVAHLNGEIYHIQTIYPRNFTEWRINLHDTNIRLKTVYANNLDNWTVETSDGYLDIYSSIIGDPRDWEVEDTLNESVGTDLKLLAIVMAIIHSTPNF